MVVSPPTRATLLVRLRDPEDQLAWREFVEIYSPLIQSYGRHRGLQEADAADLAQDVLARIVRAAPGFEYDPARGSFRGWLFTVTRNELRKRFGRATREPCGSGDSEIRRMLDEAPDEAGEAEDWDVEYRWGLVRWAADRVRHEFRDSTWQAFRQTALAGQDIDQTARALGLSTGAVYVARCRVAARIRHEIERLDPF